MPAASATSSVSSGPLTNSADDTGLSGTLKNAGTTAIKGLSHAPGFVGDIAGMADALTEIPEWLEAKITGQPFSDVVAKRNALGARSLAASDAFDKSLTGGISLDPRHYFPSGADVAAPILKETGTYQPTTAYGRYGSAAGEAVLGALGPGGGNMVSGVIKHALPNAAAGLSSQAASDATGGDPLASAVAGIGVTAVPGAIGAARSRAITNRAASVLAQGTADPQAALVAVKAGQANPIDGVSPTTAQLTGDPGIYGMQSVAAGTQARGPQFAARQQEQGRGLAAALDGSLPGGDPSKVASFFQGHFDDIGDRTQGVIDGHLADAQAKADALRGQGLPVDAYGATLRGNLVDALNAKKSAEGQLHDLVDPDGTLTTDASALKAGAAQIYGSDLPAASRARMSPAEQVFPDVVGGFGNVESYRQMAAMKSELADAMRGELSENGSSPAYRRMSMLMTHVQDAIHGTVTARAAADQAAVAAGTMAPENTLGGLLQQRAADFDARRNAGADVDARAVGNGSGGPPAVPAGAGAGVQSQGRVLGAAGNTGVPGDVAGAAPSVGSGALGAIRPIYHPGGALAVRNELVEHGSLITSHDADFRPNPAFPPNLQPRARDSAGARDQVNGMAARLQPERLGPSPEANSGAPIVGPDNVVESGNGRTMAIGKAYAAGRGEAYRQNLQSLGYDTSSFDKPVLVGRRVSPMTPEQREYFAHAANDATALRMGSAEQASADAGKITPAMLDAQSSPDITAAANRPFVQSFMSKLPAAERGGLVDQGGNLSQAGVRRIQGAMAAHAYGDKGVIAKSFDDADPNVKGLVGALTDAAGPWAKMRNAVSDGLISPEHDVTPELMQGVKLAMRARDSGRPIAELLHQGDLFNSDTSRLVTGMLTKDGNKLASRSEIEANLRNYAEEATKNVDGARLFGEAAPVGNVLRASQARAARETGSEPSSMPAAPVFSDVPPPAVANMDAGAAARYQAANAATKERARIFGAAPVADILAESGGRGNFKLPASAVPGKLFTKGPGGFEKIQAFREAAGDDHAALHTLRDHALDDLQRTARAPDGTIDPKRLEAWQANHADALRAFPELADGLRDAGAASRTMTQAAGQRRDLIKTYEKSVFGRLMNASHPDEVNAIVGDALNRPDRVMTMRKLTQAASADPVALNGLRQAVLEHVVGKSVADIESATGPARTLKAKQFVEIYQKTQPALREVLGDRATGMLGNIAAMAPRASRAMEGLGGVKNAKNLKRYLDTAAKPHESLMERLWKPAMVMGEVHELGRAFGETGELAAGGIGGLAIGARAVQAIRASGARKVGDLISDALLNPEQYASLMQTAPPKPDTGAAATLAHQLRRSAMYGTDAMSRVATHLATRSPRLVDHNDEERRRRLHPARAAGGAVEPTAAQKEAGNYRMDHRRFAGMDVSIENRKGSVRSGVDPGGKRWSVTMPADYGYLKGTVGADGDHLDCYVGPDEDAPYAWVIRQMHLHPRRFDEFKVMLGFKDRKKALRTYEAGFSDGRGAQRIGEVICRPIATFPAWARSEEAAGKPARARGGGIFGIGSTPFGVPSIAQMTGPGMKAAKTPFATGGAVRSAFTAEEGAARFQKQLVDLQRELKAASEHRATMSAPHPA